MSQQIYFIGIEQTDLFVETVVPKVLTSNVLDRKEYETDTPAISDATYLNSLNDGNTYFVGHVPKPH